MISLNDGEFEKLRARVESLNMLEEEKSVFFWSEWNRICEKEKKEKDQQVMLQAEREKSKGEAKLKLKKLELEQKN